MAPKGSYPAQSELLFLNTVRLCFAPTFTKRHFLKGDKMFEKFWNSWPKSPRKGAKSSCKAKWDKLKLDLDSDQIIKHVEWMKTTEQWKKENGEFIPAPLVYLNQQRWDGAEVPDIEITVSVAYKDPALRKIEEDAKKAAPIPSNIREKMAELLKGRVH